MSEDLVSATKILNFHGIKGDVKLGFTKGAEERIKKLKKVFVIKDNEAKVLNVQNIRFHKNFAIVKFKEFETINDIEPYKGLSVYVPKEELEAALDEDEYLITDLIGMEVFDEDGACIGSISGIGENPANALLEIEDGSGKKHLAPFVKAIVPVVDLKNKRIVINNIEGLIN